jgi:hypothetical protein
MKAIRLPTRPRFSRDVGFHCTPTGIPPGLKGRPTVAPHISRKTSEIWGTRVRGWAIVGRFVTSRDRAGARSITCEHRFGRRPHPSGRIWILTFSDPIQPQAGRARIGQRSLARYRVSPGQPCRTTPGTTSSPCPLRFLSTFKDAGRNLTELSLEAFRVFPRDAASAQNFLEIPVLTGVTRIA